MVTSLRSPDPDLSFLKSMLLWIIISANCGYLLSGRSRGAGCPATGNRYSSLKTSLFFPCWGPRLAAMALPISTCPICGGGPRCTRAHPSMRQQKPSSSGRRVVRKTATLAQNNLPAHTHAFRVKSGVGTAQLSMSTSGNHYLASIPEVPQITTESILSFTTAADISKGSTKLNTGSVVNTGGSQPHENRMPYLTMLICIALKGIFPTRD